ncbi:MAG: holo-ACP synthase [Mariprofundales bacterium]|nr:holo-ACP synthase [Mariprofundales bacterium]
MIAGIGVDRITIARVRLAITRSGQRFIDRLYTEIEQQQAAAKGDSERRFAMLFAAKEAVAKALGTGFRQGVRPCDIETVHQPSGQPTITLHHGAQKMASQLGIHHIHLSLSDEAGVAIAFAIAERSGEKSIAAENIHA